MKFSAIKQRFSSGTLLAFKNINWMIVEKLIAVPISLLLSVLLARYLGAEAFGEYSYFTALIMLVVPIAALGLNAIVSKAVVQNPDGTQKIMGTALLGRLLGCVAGAGCLAIYGLLQDPDNFTLILFLGFCQIFSAFTVFDFWFQGKLLNKYAVIARLTALIIGFGLKVVIVLLDMGLHYLVLAYGLDFVLVAFFLTHFYNRNNANATQLQTDTGYLKELLGQSKWLILSSVAAAVNLKIDLIMLANLSNNAEVGLYSVAARISEVWYFIPVAVTSAFFPMLLKAKEQNTQQYQHKLQKLNDLLFFMALMVVFPVILLSEFFITLLFGEDFRASALMLNIHILGGIFIFMRALLSKWLIAEGILRFSLITHGLGALINVIVNLLLIPEYGGVGAAVASLISYITASYLALFVSAKTRPMARIMTNSLIYPVRFIGRAKE